MLALRLSTEQPVVYSPHASRFVFFHADGVLESDSLKRSWLNDRAFREALPERTWIILDVRADGGEPALAATAGHLYPILLCRPHAKYFYNWRRKDVPNMLVLDPPSPSAVLAG